MLKPIAVLNDRALRLAIALQTKVVTAADDMAVTGRYKRNALFAGVLTGSFLSNALMAAASTTCGNSAGATATSNIVSFIGDLALFAIAIGGAGALLMFAVGAVLVIFGGNPSRVRHGMDIIKHAVIGLVVLGAGAFIKFIVIDLVLGAASQSGQTQTSVQSCLSSGSNALPSAG
jgi:hypothetical protein